MQVLLLKVRVLSITLVVLYRGCRYAGSLTEGKSSVYNFGCAVRLRDRIIIYIKLDFHSIIPYMGITCNSQYGSNSF